MTQLTNYLSFNGNCGEAMRFYEETLNGKIETLMTNGQSPAAEHCSPGASDRIMHACLTFDGAMLMAGDVPEHLPYEGMKGFNLTVTYDDTARARQVFDALSDGGTVTMPFEKTFWAEGAGMVTDRFGTPWIINGARVEF